MSKTAKPEDLSADNPNHIKRKSPFWAIFSVLMMLIAIIALAASAYCYYLIQQQKNRLAEQTNQQFSTLTKGVAKVKQNLNTLSSSHERLQAKLGNYNTMTGQSLDALKKAQLSLQTELAAYKNAPRIGVGEDLLTLHFLNAKLSLQLAEQSIRLSRPAAQIQQSLNLARNNLLPIGDTAKPLLEQLQRLSMGIADLPNVDTLSLLKAINQLDKQLATLQFNLPVKGKVIPAKITHATTWQDYLQQSWHALKQFLIINHDSRVDQQLISRASRLSALQSTRLDLALARWGVVEGNTARFKEGMLQADAKVSTIFQNTAASRQWLAQSKLIATKPAGYPTTKLTVKMNQLYNMLTTLQSETHKH